MTMSMSVGILEGEGAEWPGPPPKFVESVSKIVLKKSKLDEQKLKSDKSV